MELPEFLSSARDTMSVKRVFGEPFEKDGVTIIPAARVAGGGGGGSGGDANGGQGTGGGFGMKASPVGAFVIKDGKVSWIPAVDVNRVILGAQFAAVFMLLSMRAMMRRRMRMRMRMAKHGRPGRRFGPPCRM